MSIVIKAENLSKLYYLGGAKHDSLRDAVMSFVKKPALSKTKNELWALRDVSFSLEEGETLGIIGNNGAGKSTLLKILSRITKPTGGTAELHGRVGSLLEVGTGFHNELTGRENIFLNGAILGMQRSEIEKRFDEIVAFSEVEKFLDTPVKHYSSGMYMRLAFAVAAHLEPEILIVDEVLAVGDASFQKKCLNKMQDISGRGRTVLFVSHNLQAVSRLCSRTIWIDKGILREDGKTPTVIGNFLNAATELGSERNWEIHENAPGNEIVRLRRVCATDENGEIYSSFDIRRPIFLEQTYEVLQGGKIFTPAFHLYNEESVCLFATNDMSHEWRDSPREKGVYTSRAQIPANFLAEGNFYATAISFSVATQENYFFVTDAIRFNVFDGLDGDSARGDFAGVMIGAVRPLLDWQTEYKKAF
jgi:lipopolysaccharide transport system ATP-binding protein